MLAGHQIGGFIKRFVRSAMYPAQTSGGEHSNSGLSGDVRGCGDSEGLIADEYTEQELRDAEAEGRAPARR